ncbi:MAG: DNA polymerase III subunit delta [Wenzhouxiangella sp.]
MKVFPDRLEQTLSRGVAPVYLVAGPELLLVEEASDAIRKAARAAGVSERQVIDAEGRFDWNELGAASENLSLFATRRLLEVRLPSGKPGREGGAALREWVKQPGDDILLIKAQAWEIASEKTAWFRDLEKAGVFVPCWSVKPARLPQWIGQRLGQRGIRADEAACRFLAERLEGNLLAAAQEVERISLLSGRGASLDIDQLKAVVGDSARFDGFRLVELVLSGQAGAALRCIRGLAEAEIPMPMIVFALAREVQVIEGFQALRRQMSEGEAFKALKVWSSREQPIRDAARRLPARHLQRAIGALAELDFMAKSNQRSEFWLHLERLCVALAQPDREWSLA